MTDGLRFLKTLCRCFICKPRTLYFCRPVLVNVNCYFWQVSGLH